MRRSALTATLALALLVAACSASDDGDATTTTLAPDTTAAPGETPTTVAAPGGDLAAVGIGTQKIAEVDQPIALAARPSSPDLYIATQDGTVRVVKVTRTEPTGTASAKVTYQLQSTPILDLSDDVINEGERGLLGLAFSTDGRRLYVDYTAAPDGRTIVAEYELGDRPTVDLRSRRELLSIPQPAANHNGGQLAFGPDGFLYVALGDGGGAGDPDGRGQDTSELLGSLLRIDPDVPDEDDPAAYRIPEGNPFADGAEGLPEIWAYGLRNPWRFTFDRATGDLWIGDVGEGEWEEVDVLRANGGFDAGRGANLGWDQMEGTHSFEGGENPDGAVLPAFEYPHSEGGCSITGGYVYRGEAIAGLEGSYLFADYCVPGIRAIQVDAADAVRADRAFDLPVQQVVSFGEDRDGELYVLGDGVVLKLVPA